MTLRRTAAVGAVGAGVLAIAIPVTLAARQQSAAPAPAAAAPAATEMTPPDLTPSEHQALPKSSGTPVPGVVKGMPNRPGCPVEAADLLLALQHSKISQQLPATRHLTDVDCSATYAIARTETATVIFRYSETTDSWRAISGGPSESCAKVPEAVRPQLKGCT